MSAPDEQLEVRESDQSEDTPQEFGGVWAERWSPRAMRHRRIVRLFDSPPDL